MMDWCSLFRNQPVVTVHTNSVIGEFRRNVCMMQGCGWDPSVKPLLQYSLTLVAPFRDVDNTIQTRAL